MVTDLGQSREGGGGRGAGPARVYVGADREQLFLMPLSMREWLDEGHLAWFVIDVVGELDTRALHRRPGGSLGRPPYDPQMICALLLYAYCCGIRSSRRIEAACRTDAAFRVICGGLEPDHSTIARFVVDNQGALGGLFTSGLRLCAAAGLADLSVVALDGTKMAADAAIDQNRDAQWIAGEVGRLLAATAADEPERASAQDVLAGIDPALAAGLAAPRGRVARLHGALAVIEAEQAAITQAAARKNEAALQQARQGRKTRGRKPKDPAAALARAQADYEAAVTRAAAKQAKHAEKVAAAQAAGRPVRGVGPGADRDLQRADTALKAAEQAARAAPPKPASANITDPDSRIMKTQKGWVQGYNAQAITNKHQIVLACDVSQDANDVLLYQPMIAKLQQTLTAAGITAAIELCLADAGYWSQDNATAPGPDRLIATTKDHKQRAAARQLGHTSGPPPPDATALEEMEHLLRTPQGTAAYALRSHTIEPVFADAKHNRAMPGFRRRGTEAVQSEWSFINLATNTLKLFRHRATAAAAIA